MIKQPIKQKQTHIYSTHNPKLSQYDPQHPYIPLTMFLMLPSTQDDYYVGEGKSIRRFLFQGTAKDTFTKFQLEKYREFGEYWDMNKAKLPPKIVDNPFWDYSWKMRWLTSQQYDVKNAIKAMEAHTTYLQTNRKNVTPNAQKLLKQGIFYIAGRDAYFRPILVFDIDKMIKSDMTPQELIQAQKFFFQVVMDEYLLPGQVETWVAIIDVGYNNVTSLISPMKASFGFLANTFRNRMRICYVVRIPGTLSFLWRIIKNFLHQDTAKKINFIDDQVVAPLLQYTNPSQLQTKYGGTQPQITQFWPPRTVKKLQQLNLLNFSHPDVVSIPISQQSYKTKHQKNKLTGHKICKILIEDQIKQQQQSTKKIQENLHHGHQEKIGDQVGKVGSGVGVEMQGGKIVWPREYQPLAAPVLSSQDCIDWCALLQ